MTFSESLSPQMAARLLRQQETLQAQVQSILLDLNIIHVLAQCGTPIQIGSSVTGLMVWRDIDFNISCPGSSADDIFAVLRPLFTHPRVKQLRYLNDSGAFNTSGLPQNERFYIALLYVPPGGDEWKIDISFWLADLPRSEARLTESLMRQLTDETRLAILWIKEVWQCLPSYRSQVLSIDIYDAVLQHHVRTPREFDAYLLTQGKPARNTQEIE